jgi:hypothetical protein
MEQHDTHEFYTIFYNIIDNTIANFINIDNNLRNIISFEDKKKHILNNAFPITNFNNRDNLINMINNNLELYLKMAEFVKEMERPYMPVLVDVTQMQYIFNKFFYHYAKLCMNNNCQFSQDLYIRTINLQYI